MHLFGATPPTQVKPLKRRHVLAAALCAALLNLSFTVGATDDGAFWRATPNMMAGYLWLAKYWITLTVSIWACAAFIALVRSRTTTWRTFAAILTIGLLPSVTLTLVLR